MKAKFVGISNGCYQFTSNAGRLWLHLNTTDGIVDRVCDKQQLYYALSYLLSVAYQGKYPDGIEVV